MRHDVVILGVFVVDAAFRCDQMPKAGETRIGTGFTLGPGGKGSNQAVAAARAGGAVGFITRIGQDGFAAIADQTWAEAGVAPLVLRDAARPTGAAGIFIDDRSGENAIVITPGAAGALTPADVQSHAATIGQAKVIVTQLEQSIDAAETFLHLGAKAGAATVLNPAPAAAIPDRILALCDYLTPNETEATLLTGHPVGSASEATVAAKMLLARGVKRAVIVTLGEKGALIHDHQGSRIIPPFSAGPAIDTTGAGDAFNGAFATALAEGRDLDAALRFAMAAGALAVTKSGAAAAMPPRTAIDALLRTPA